MYNCAFVRRTHQYRANSCLRTPCTEDASLTGAQSTGLVTQRCTDAYNEDQKEASLWRNKFLLQSGLFIEVPWQCWWHDTRGVRPHRPSSQGWHDTRHLQYWTHPFVIHFQNLPSPLLHPLLLPQLLQLTPHPFALIVPLPAVIALWKQTCLLQDLLKLLPQLHNLIKPLLFQPSTTTPLVWLAASFGLHLWAQEEWEENSESPWKRHKGVSLWFSTKDAPICSLHSHYLLTVAYRAMGSIQSNG